MTKEELIARMDKTAATLRGDDEELMMGALACNTMIGNDPVAKAMAVINGGALMTLLMMVGLRSAP